MYFIEMLLTFSLVGRQTGRAKGGAGSVVVVARIEFVDVVSISKE